jgi:hypothetical protein
MSEVSATITLEPVTAVVQPQNNIINFTPTDFQVNIYTSGAFSNAIPAKGYHGSVQYNKNGFLNGTTVLFYDDVNYILTLGGPQNIKITGGLNGSVLSTDSVGNLSWTTRIANSNYANISGYADSSNTSNSSLTSNYANSANTANTAVSATNATNATNANVANLAYGLSAGLANVTISGGTSGQYLQTNGSGVLSWTTVTVPPSGANALANLTDVSFPSPLVNGQQLVYDSVTSKWTNKIVGGSTSPVTSIIAGNNITITSTGAGGTGAVTINSTGGGGGSSGVVTIYTRSGSANATITGGKITLVGRSGNVAIATS